MTQFCVCSAASALTFAPIGCDSQRTLNVNQVFT